MSPRNVLRQTSGIAGAIRVYWGDPAYLERMERHGKHLDPTSRARAESYMRETFGYFDVERLPAPVTTTGLDLQLLYEQHLGNVHRDRRSTGRFLHLIVQFPTQLVDGEDTQWMLTQARQFCEAVFGSQAIFADRVDRHETGRHTVDMFVAPLVEKKTKHTSKPALSLTKGLDALCDRLDIKPRRGGPQGLLKAYGKALQTAWFDHLVAAGVEGVVRGEEKDSIDPDRVSPEVYKVRKEREILAQEAAEEQEKIRIEKERIAKLQTENERAAADIEYNWEAFDQAWSKVEKLSERARLAEQEALAERQAASTAKREAEALKATAKRELNEAVVARTKAKQDHDGVR